VTLEDGWRNVRILETAREQTLQYALQHPCDVS
jgi:hypothetical protein